MGGLPYFARAVSYKHKMFIKLTTGVKAAKLLSSSSLILHQNELA
jgi:hypothetical protein